MVTIIFTSTLIVNLFLFSVSFLILPVIGHLDLPEACVVHPYSKKSIDECDVSGDFWSLLVYNQRDIFTCCKNERDASIAAGKGYIYHQSS